MTPLASVKMVLSTEVSDISTKETDLHNRIYKENERKLIPWLKLSHTLLNYEDV